MDSIWLNKHRKNKWKSLQILMGILECDNVQKKSKYSRIVKRITCENIDDLTLVHIQKDNMWIVTNISW